MIKKAEELLFLFLFGGTAYGLCELLWRGYTHYSMVILGGICFAVIFSADKKFCDISFALRCFVAGIFITSMELVCGCIVNVIFKLGVWDYSLMPLNFMGQICLNFSLMWIVLSAGVLPICRVLRKYIC